MALNLTQRRMVQEFQNGQFKSWLPTFHEIVGFELPVEPQWDTFFFDTDRMSAETITSCWMDHYFRSLEHAFRGVCGDAMGRDAVKAGVKKVVIDGSQDTTNPRNSTFDGGVLTINHKPCSYSASVEERGDAWRRILEEKL